MYSLAAVSARPRILVIVDTPNWAHDRKTDILAVHLAPAYEIRKRYQSEVTAEDILDADAVLVYYWLQIERLKMPKVFKEVRARLMIGVCSHYELQGEWKKPGLAMLSRLPRAVFANNRLLLDELRGCVRTPVYYTPNGVDTSFFRPPPTRSNGAGPLRVGWTGSLANQTAAHRGVHEHIVPAARAAGAQLCFAIREEKWRTLDEMRDFYHSIDAYVCASRSEGTPNPALEASASGVPVVSTRVGSMPEFIRDGENGFLVDRDAAAIAAKLRILRDNRVLRHRMGDAAREAAEGWDWQLLAPNYAAMFRDVLASPRRNSLADRLRAILR
jgi:glycosyltransferase involved in cell wall biosynthesis